MVQHQIYRFLIYDSPVIGYIFFNPTVKYLNYDVNHFFNRIILLLCRGQIIDKKLSKK